MQDMRACHSDLFSSELIIKEAFSITRKLFSSELGFLLNGDHIEREKYN